MAKSKSVKKVKAFRPEKTKKKLISKKNEKRLLKKT